MSVTVAVFGLGKYQLNGVNELKKNNFNIIGFDEKKNPYLKKSVNSFYQISFLDIQKVKKICVKYNIKYLFSFNTEAPLRLISLLNQKLNLSGYKKKNIELISNKINLRKFFKSKMNLKSPNFLYYENTTNIETKTKIKFPIVCKPNIGSGSKGVFFTKKKSELSKLFQINKKFYKNKKILIEEFIDSNEFAVEGWIYRKKFIFGCLSKKVRSKPPYLLDTSLIINYQNTKIKKNIINFMKKFSEKSKIDNMPIHFEFFQEKGNIIPVDISLRGAGFGVYSNILSRIIGQSTDRILIDLILNKKIFFNKPNKKIFFLNFFDSKKKGIFKGITNIKKLKLLKSFLEIDLYKKINEKVFPLKNGRDRIGHLLLGGYAKDIDKDINFVNKFIKPKVTNGRI